MIRVERIVAKVNKLINRNSLANASPLRDGQRETRSRADALFALQPQFAAVRADQTLRDGEAQAMPAARSGLVGAIEAFAHARQLISRNADAFINHLNQHQPIGCG